MQTVNFLKYKVTKTKSGKDYVITIKLADECKNGHNDFSITGEIYEAGKRGDKNMFSAGACGEEIGNKFPNFKIFDDLHLSDVNGAPMYAIANGFYHLQNSDLKVASQYLRCTIDEAKFLFDNSEDQEIFTYNINKLGLISHWKAEANKAIELLEQLTGEKFEDNSKTLQSVYLSKEKEAEIIAKIKAGYYKSGEIQKRKQEKIAFEKQQKFDELKNDYDKAVKEHTDEYNVKHFVLSNGFDIDNLIYYNHTREAHFNWKSYGNQISQQEFDRFIEIFKTSKSKLPKGVIFKLAKK